MRPGVCLGNCSNAELPSPGQLACTIPELDDELLDELLEEELLVDELLVEELLVDELLVDELLEEDEELLDDVSPPVPVPPHPMIPKIDMIANPARRASELRLLILVLRFG